MADAEPLTNPLEEEEVVTPPTEELEPEELEEIEELEPEEDSPEEEEPEDEEPKISRREQLRIQDLLSRERSEDPKPRGRDDRLDYRKEFQVEDDDAQRLEQDRQAEAQFYYEQGLEQAKSLQFHTRLEVDAPRVESRYPILDKNSDQFHPALANTINTMYLSAVGFDKKSDTVQNADLRYSDYAEGIMELGEEIGKFLAQKQVDEVKAQAAKTGLRPDGSKAPKLDLNKAPQDMSDEELDAFLSTQFKR